MNKNFTLTAPVIFIIFNRPDTTKKVFERICKARPQKLFIAADGPRADKPGEAENCRQCREIVSKVDWDCEVHTNFSDVNLGCKWRMVSGITWAFEHVEELIILEDDCLPAISFFRFCQEMLERYRHDTRIFTVTGNQHDLTEKFDESYTFLTGGGGIWGWATWKRVWEIFDPNMKLWPEFREKKLLRCVTPSPDINDSYRRFSSGFDHGFGNNSIWGYPFVFHIFMNNGLGIVPKVNMVKNIGFGEVSTHTSNPFHKEAFYMDSDMNFPLTHPKFIVPTPRFYDPYDLPANKEERDLELKERKAHFENLVSQKNYSAILDYFNDMLRNAKVFRFFYVYYLAYAYLMLEDYEHAVMLVEDILKATYFDIDRLYVFAKTFFDKGLTDESLKVLNNILQREKDLQNIDDDLKSEIKSLALSLNVNW